jgi:hypothetical protein
VVQPPVDMAKIQDQSRCAQDASQSYYGAVDGSLPLHLNPVARSSSDVRSIESFGDNPLEAGHTKPALGDLVIGCMCDQLQARMPAVEKTLQRLTTFRKQAICIVLTSELENVEHEKDGGPILDDVGDELSREGQAVLKCAEVSLAAVVRDDNLAVDQRVGREDLGSLDDLGEPGPQVATTPTEQLCHRAVASPQLPAEAVHLWLVRPPVTAW